jgi:hypothetical protein
LVKAFWHLGHLPGDTEATPTHLAGQKYVNGLPLSVLDTMGALAFLRCVVSCANESVEQKASIVITQINFFIRN